MVHVVLRNLPPPIARRSSRAALAFAAAWLTAGGCGSVSDTHQLPAPTYDLALGTADPTDVKASARSGRWVVACQARRDTDGDGRIRVEVGTDCLEGDTMVPYLFRGGGEGSAIDAFLARSPDDRWLAVMRDGQLVVIDDLRGSETVVRDADVQPNLLGITNLAAFDGESRRLVYFRRAAERRVVVVRDLIEQREHEVPLAQPVLELLPDRQGTWAGLWFAPLHRPGAVRRGILVATADAARGQTCGTCAGYPDHTIRDDQPRDAWLRLDTGQLEAAQAVLGHLGGRSIVRAPDGALLVGQDAIVPAGCGAEIVAALATPVRIVTICRAVRGNPVELFGPGLRVVLAATSAPDRAPRDVRVLDEPYYCGDEATCFSLEDGHRAPLRAASRVWEDVPGHVLAVDLRGRALVGSDDPQRADHGDRPFGPLRWLERRLIDASRPGIRDR